MINPTYATLPELVEREIIPTLGDFAGDFDLEQITGALRDAELITYDGNGFVLTSAVDPMAEEFDQDAFDRMQAIIVKADRSTEQ